MGSTKVPRQVNRKKGGKRAAQQTKQVTWDYDNSEEEGPAPQKAPTTGFVTADDLKQTKAKAEPIVSSITSKKKRDGYKPKEEAKEKEAARSRALEVPAGAQPSQRKLKRDRAGMSAGTPARTKRTKVAVQNGDDVSGSEMSEEDAPEGSVSGDDDRHVDLNDSGNEEEGEEEEVTEAVESKSGGMGDVISRILAQELDGGADSTAAPVLAKRRTRAMREMEEEAERKASAIEKRARKREQQTQQLVLPSVETMETERQLRKIATRGVVALFNAISQHQISTGTVESLSGGKKGLKKGAIKQAKSSFMQELKKKAVGPGESQNGGEQNLSKFEKVDENESAGWAVLRDDYMIGAKTMKDWDQESEASELNEEPEIRPLDEGSDSGED